MYLKVYFRTFQQAVSQRLLIRATHIFSLPAPSSLTFSLVDHRSVPIGVSLSPVTVQDETTALYRIVMRLDSLQRWLGVSTALAINQYSGMRMRTESLFLSLSQRVRGGRKEIIFKFNSR